MLTENRYGAFLELSNYCDNNEIRNTIAESNNISALFEDANIIFNDIFSYYNNDCKLILESGGIKKVLSKSKSAVAKLVKGCKKLADYLKSKIMDKAISLSKNSAYKNTKAAIKGVPAEIKKKFKNSFSWLNKKFNEFKKMNTYKKVVIPSAMILGYVPPFTPIPGITEVFIAVSSLGDFLLDFKRGFLNQEYSAITEFSNYVQSKMDSMDETTILASDKLMQKALDYVNALMDEIKVVFISLTKATSKGVEKAADKIGKASNKSGKLSEKMEKTKKVAQEVNKNSSDAISRFKEYKRKKANTKYNEGGGKNLSKADVKRLQRDNKVLA